MPAAMVPVPMTTIFSNVFTHNKTGSLHFSDPASSNYSGPIFHLNSARFGWFTNASQASAPTQRQQEKKHPH
jgi:hypothetical protein